MLIGRQTDLVRHGMVPDERTRLTEDIILNSILQELVEEYPDFNIRRPRIVGKTQGRGPDAQPILHVHMNFRTPEGSTEQAVQYTLLQALQKKLEKDSARFEARIVSSDELHQFQPPAPFYVIR